jgi:hypothetical protein
LPTPKLLVIADEDLGAEGGKLLLYPIRSLQNPIKLTRVTGKMKLIRQLRQAPFVVVGSVLLSGGSRVEIVRQSSMKLGFGGVIVLFARHLRHLTVEELQERLVVDALLDEEWGELPVETDPYRGR